MEVKEKRTYISPRVTDTDIAYPISLMAGSPEFRPSTSESKVVEGDAKYHTSYSLWEEEESYE